MSECFVSDIHMHVIPYVDDGADDFDDALAMLRIAYEEGVRSIIATPHSAAFDPWRNNVKKYFDLLREKAKDEELDIDLMLGAEIRIYPDEMKKIVKKIRKGKYPTLNGTDKVLVEFQLIDGDFCRIEECMDLLIYSGYTPVIAHAERYRFSVDQIYELVERGGRIQINFDDVIPVKGDPMSEKANRMLKDQMVDYIATDAHHSYRRTPCIREEMEFLYSEYDSGYIDRILTNMIA